MSKTKNTKNLTVSYCGFGGIDRTLTHSDKPVAEDIVNFRIRKDGSLEKRCGYVPFIELGSRIRALYSTSQKGKNILYALVGDEVFSIDCGTATKTKLATIETIMVYSKDIAKEDSVAIEKLSPESAGDTRGKI